MAVDEGRILRLVLSEMAREGLRYAPAGISMRHVHLSKTDLHTLFGPGYELHPIRDLVQPGQFAAREQVTVAGPKGTLEKVRIIGPVRDETQVELSMTDAIAIGIKNAEVRMSGHLDHTPGIRLLGPSGEVTLSRGTIVAARHLHLSEEQARAFRVHDGQVVSVRIGGTRALILDRVICRTGRGHELEFHVDTDEANACLLKNGDLVEVLLPGEEETSKAESTFDPVGISEKVLFGLTGNRTIKTDKTELFGEERKTMEGEPVLELVTEQDINLAASKNADHVVCAPKALVTPAARDRALLLQIRIDRADDLPGISVRPEAGQEVLELVTAGDLNVAFRDDRKEIFCTQNALITPAARERIEETGIRIIRTGS